MGDFISMNHRTELRRGFKILLVISAVAGNVAAQERTVVSFSHFKPGEIQAAVLTVKEPAKLRIRALGAAWKEDGDLYAYGWILDLGSRKVVWEMDRDNTESVRRTHVREFDGTVKLNAGLYKVYYFAGRPFFFGGKTDINSWDDFWNLLGNIFSGERYDEKNWEKVGSKFFLEAAAAGAVTLADGDPYEKRAIVALTKPGNSRSLSAGFSVGAEVKVKIYASGEYDDNTGTLADYGWIIDAGTRKRVWEMDRHHVDPAGGAEKNVQFTGEIGLPRGNYVATFITDDSHAYGKWNALPPSDPDNYGLVILPAAEGERKLFAPYTDTYREPVVIQLVEVGDDDYVSAGFTLDRGTELHIYALGEYDQGEDQLADYGWIEDAGTGKKVWEMTPDNVVPAGGAEKNKKFDDVITLPRGSYVVNYLSDGSHSYRHWNSAAPPDPEHWGITISGFGKNFDPKAVHPYEPKEAQGDILTQMIRLKDDEDRREKFSLTGPTQVRIYALGEGDEDEMYDYGWIVNKRTGRTVWEMTWRNTEPAGGATKNRKYDDIVWLDKGEYEVHFVTDGSHAFGDWNAARPADPTHWGITITRVK